MRSIKPIFSLFYWHSITTLLALSSLVSACSFPSSNNEVPQESATLASTEPSGFVQKKSLLDSSGEVIGTQPINKSGLPGEIFLNVINEYVPGSEIQARLASPLLGSSGGAEATAVDKDFDSDGVIIELKGPSVAKVASEAKNRGDSASQVGQAAVARHRELQLSHEALKRRLEAKFQMKLVEYAPTKQAGKIRYRQFETTIHGLALFDVSPQQAKAVIGNDADVLSISPNFKVQAVLNESLKILGVDRALQINDLSGDRLDGTGVRIGVLDTGVNYLHADLGGCLGGNCKVAGGFDFINNDADPKDDHGHGTHVAATAAGSGSYVDASGVRHPLPGVASGAKIYALKVLNSAGSGSFATVIAGMEFCGDPNSDGNPADHLDVCTMSLGGNGNPDDAQSKAADSLSDLGVVMTIAAGNSGPGQGTISSPGTSRSAITVAASCKPGDTSAHCMTNGVALQIATFSARGPVSWRDASGVIQTIMKPDIAAPGVKICAAQSPGYATTSQCLDLSHIAISGTSMATPHIAGLAAILLQVHPELTPAAVKAALKESAVSLGRPEYEQGAGQADIMKALEKVGLPKPSELKITGPNWISDNTQQLLQTFSNVYTITNVSNNSLTLTPGFESTNPGLTGVFDKTSFTLAAGASTSLTASLTVDHSVVGRGTLTSYIVLNGTASPVKYGVRVEVADRLVPSLRDVNFLAFAPTVPSWSKTLAVNFTNKLSDASVSYQVVTECCLDFTGAKPDGISLSSNQSVLNLSAGQTASLNLTMNANNSLLQNYGYYKGRIRLVSQLETIEITVQVFRGAVFKLVHGSTSLRPFVLRLINPDFTASVKTFSTEATELVYWAARGPMAVMAGFVNLNQVSYLAYDNLATDAEGFYIVPLDPALANRQVSITDPIRPNGTRIGTGKNRMKFAMRWQELSWDATYKYPGTNETWKYYNNPPLLSASCDDCLQPGYSIKTNDFSKKFLLQFSIQPAASTSMAGAEDYLYSIENGVSGNIALSNSQSNFFTHEVRAASNDIVSTRYVAGSDEGVLGSYSHTSGADPFAYYITPEKPATHYSAVVRDISDSLSNVKLPAVLPYLDITKRTDPYGIYASFGVSQYFQLSTAGSKFWIYKGTSSFAPSVRQPRVNVLGFDVAPGYIPTSIEISKYQYGNSFAPNTSNSALRSSAGDIVAAYMIPGFKVYSEAKLNGALLPYGSEYGSYSTWLNPGSAVLQPGQYEATKYYDRNFNGQTMRSSSRWNFTIPSTYVDTPVGPPQLEGLSVWANGTLSSKVRNDQTNTVEFAVNPIGLNDSIASVKAEVSLDGGASWQSLAITTISVGDYRTSAVPTAAGTSLYNFRITAIDSVGSQLVHQFQMQAGASVDASPPVATVTSPTNGTSVTGTVQIKASGSDDFGVTRMELFIDGQFSSSATGGLLTYSWNTLGVSDGAHTIYAKAYDASGKVGQSTIVTVTVANYANDTVPPTAASALTATAGKGGNPTYVILNWTPATDNVKLAGYRVYRDGVKIADISTTTTFTDSALPATTQVSYYLIAVDMAGNVSPPSNTATVTLGKGRRR